MLSGKTVETGGLQKNWKERVQPRVQPQPHRSSITASHPDSGDDQNDQVPVAPKVQAIQKKQQTTTKVTIPGQSNHQKGTKTVISIY
jgi:hypothetical protein